MKPLLSVLMPTYNNVPYLARAIQSILDQTFKDFELLVLDDGSTDGTWAIIQEMARKDKRIVPFRHDENQGVAKSTNALLALAQGDYIALMDGDDVSFPERLARQILFLDSQADGFCGTWYKTAAWLQPKTVRLPLQDAAIRVRLLFGVGCHKSTITGKTAILKKIQFPEQYTKGGSDYGWMIALAAHTSMANIAIPLFYYRCHAGQITRREKKIAMTNLPRLRRLYLEQIGIPANEEEKVIHANISDAVPLSRLEDVEKRQDWLLKLVDYYPEPALAAIIASHWYWVCVQATQLGPLVWHLYQKSPLRLLSPRSSIAEGKLFAACIARLPYAGFYYQLMDHLRIRSSSWYKP